LTLAIKSPGEISTNCFKWLKYNKFLLLPNTRLSPVSVLWKLEDLEGIHGSGTSLQGHCAFTAAQFLSRADSLKTSMLKNLSRMASLLRKQRGLVILVFVCLATLLFKYTIMQDFGDDLTNGTATGSRSTDVLFQNDSPDGLSAQESDAISKDAQWDIPRRCDNCSYTPIIGKITVSFGETEEVYERAMRSHHYHNEVHGYKQFVLRERLLNGLWSKHAFIFSIIAQELSKPESERLKWIMYIPSFFPSKLATVLLPKHITDIYWDAGG